MEKTPDPSSPAPRPASKRVSTEAMETPDLELVRRIRDGEQAAFGTFVERWNAELLRLGHRLTGDPHEAAEVRQETLVKLYDRIRGFEGRSRVATWVYRIAVNVARDRARRRETFARALNGRAHAKPLNGHTLEGPVQAQERVEVADRVAAAVSELADDEREVLVLRHYHDLPFTDIAQVVGAPVTTVKSRMTRGLERLRHRLKDLQP